ncbi:MAG: dynamin family protein [Prevotellaceae bacterium]|nr:dynamin family protein [Prevotellaceae bacterium]
MKQNNFINILSPHIQFVRDVFKRYEWEANVKHELEADMYCLQQRINDDCVNIAVVGEFSSGKSSVINAMLGIDLLVMDDLPDTTLVPSIISYSEKPFLEVIYSQGDNSGKTEMTIERIRDYIAEYSFRESLMKEKNYDDAYINEMTNLRAAIAKKASKIKQFNIGIPSMFLKQGFRIIDTPGLNSLNSDCTRVTNNVLATADAAIIVGMATDGGLHQEFREKLAETFGDRMEQSCIIFTHYDHMTPERRERNLTYLHAVTASYFNLMPDSLMVVPMVPPTILANLKGNRFGKEHDEMLRISCNSMGKVIDFSVKQRESTIINSLQKILTRILSNLQVRIPELKRKYEQRLIELDRSRTTPIETFISQELDSLVRIINIEAATRRTTISQNLDKIAADTKKKLENDILRRSDLESLQKFMQVGLKITLKHTSENMNAQATDGGVFISNAVSNQLDSFEIALKEEFRRLNIVHLPIKKILVENKTQDIELVDSMNDAIKFADSELERENTGYGLAVVGAVIGSIFTFGIGSVIGAAIGSLLGSRCRSTNVCDVFKRMKPKYEKELNAALDLQKSNVLASYDSSVRNHISSFTHQLNSYQERYKSEVDNLIVTEKQNRFRINKAVEQIEEDLKEINNHQNKIRSLWKIN